MLAREDEQYIDSWSRIFGSHSLLSLDDIPLLSLLPCGVLEYVTAKFQCQCCLSNQDVTLQRQSSNNTYDTRSCVHLVLRTMSLILIFKHETQSVRYI